MARARAQLEQSGQGGTARTDETQVLSVSSAPGVGATQKRAGVSSVLSVAGPEHVAIDSGAGAAMQAVAANDARVAAPASAPALNRGNPYMTREQGDECHACGWNDAEIETFIARAKRFALLGRDDAEHLAERLTLRDRQADHRALCVECRELEVTGRCAAARRGAIPGADRRLEPVQNILMRCEGFKGTVSAHRGHTGNEDADDDNRST